MAGSESDSAGPLGTTENRLVNSDATASREKEEQKLCSESTAALKEATAVDYITVPNNRIYRGLC